MTIDVADHSPSRAPLSSANGGFIQLRGVAKRFGDHRVLQGIDLAIEPGQFVAIVGRSGCGKSTLLRLVAGLDTPTDGRVVMDDMANERANERAGNRAAGRREAMRLMFQEPRLLPWQRVAANVAVGLAHAADRQARRAQAEDALREVGLADRAGAWPSVLSGGQKQRVALARALVSQPRLLLLDEPLGALDALTRIEMQQLIERVWREKGFTAIVVTHDVSEAVTLADRIVVLENGAVALDVPVDLPRPRRRGDREAAAIEGRILDHLLRH